MQRTHLVLLQLASLFCLISIFLFSFRGLPSASFVLSQANPSIREWLTSLKESATHAITKLTGIETIEDDAPLKPTEYVRPTPTHDGDAVAVTIDSYYSVGPSSTEIGNPGFDTQPYLKAIFDPGDQSFDRLECHSPAGSRYDYLRVGSTDGNSEGKRSFYFALDLHDNADLLPRLMGTLIEIICFLGPRNCAVSIVEGRSEDGTYEILKAVTDELKAFGILYILQKDDINPLEGGNRIQALAEFRNKALRPLISGKEQWSSNTIVIFLNDVAICMEDILELIHQHRFQQADMVCPMDWTYVGPDPTFYDIWIARDMDGESFFEIPKDRSWDSAWNLLWNNPDARSRLFTGKPFQVFSCWNGAAVFRDEPILDHGLSFRSNIEGECYQGEPQIFCKEMWSLGYGKIAVVPTVNLECSDEAARRIKALKGYVSDWVGEGLTAAASSKIDWVREPPRQVKCIPADYAQQFLVDWNESLNNKGDSTTNRSRLNTRRVSDQYWVPWNEGLPN
ncbi:putative alpha-mannosyltransferase cmt1 [Phaeomoniella chlamydospora]|uniref:Putative alpha-mannosyltransferase cmt1 n=1 Tax=Phaeomoniella chlamydospora TaxID=158046 RepID=A0A0G2E9V1_PHACM|nr:putative alpha-mannosyltransferase cmt1 [Phaeomoniella chlamydospora]